MLGLKLKICCSLWSSLVCEMVSYAFDRSKYMASVGCFLFMCFSSLSIMVCSAMLVLEFGLKAYCVAAMILCWMQCIIIWVLMSLSNILPMIEVI